MLCRAVPPTPTLGTGLRADTLSLRVGLEATTADLLSRRSEALPVVPLLPILNSTKLAHLLPWLLLSVLPYSTLLVMVITFNYTIVNNYNSLSANL